MDQEMLPVHNQNVPNTQPVYKEGEPVYHGFFADTGDN